MTSYQTVQLVAFTASPIATDYVVLAPGYTFSNGSVAAGAAASSATSLTLTSAFSTQVGNSNVTLDLPAVVTAASYTSVTVDKYGRVTAGANPAAAASGMTFWEAMSMVALGF